jgi:cell division protein FtsZ
VEGRIVAAPQNYLAVIKVVGIGGGGVNAINRMIEVGLKGVEFIAVNTDAQALLMSDADVKLDVGRELTAGSAPAPTPRSASAPPRITPRRSRRSSRGPTWSS